MKKWDIVIIIFLIILSILPIALIFNKVEDSGEKEVLISVDGREYSRFLLSDEEREILIENGGRVNVIHIRGESVLMKNTDCPDRLCTKKGEIRKIGESIVCLPNKIFIEIIGSSEEDIIMSY